MLFTAMTQEVPASLIHSASLKILFLLPQGLGLASQRAFLLWRLNKFLPFLREKIMSGVGEETNM